MRLHRLRFDIWLCLLVAYLVSLGTGAAASALSSAEGSYAESILMHRLEQEKDEGVLKTIRESLAAMKNRAK